MANGPRNDEILDVAVVGGGVSGIYSAWRLLTAAPHGTRPRIAIFEGSTRLCGRLLSVTPPGIPHTRVELGGMRFTPSHVCVAGLTRYLGLTSVPFPVHEPENIAFLRGRALRFQDLDDPGLLPYDLLPDERTPTALANGMTALAAQRTLRTMLNKDVDLATVDWPRIARTERYHGQLLREVSLSFLMQRNLSTEAVEFATDTSGYDQILRIWNGADGFPWNLGDFGTTVDYFHVQPGYDALPLTMADRFTDAGGTIHLSCRLTSLHETSLADGSKAIALQFAGTLDGRRILARRVILAMPRRSLELIDARGTVLADPAVQNLIRSVTPVPLFKLAICYPYPWWQTIDPVPIKSGATTRWLKLTKGETICDLPVRQCYYWAVDPKTQNGVVLIYDDGKDLEYWATLRDVRTATPFADNRPAAETASNEWTMHPAPARMVQEAHRQLLLIHGVSDRPDIPQPYAAAYRDWGEDPYGGGANYWHLHVDSQHVSEAILQPKPPVPVYICGEAYSHNQGWVEGALETADALLERHFSLPRPPWLASPPVQGKKPA
jgi:Flavin containing amine oxidoreductase